MWWAPHVVGFATPRHGWWEASTWANDEHPTHTTRNQSSYDFFPMTLDKIVTTLSNLWLFLWSQLDLVTLVNFCHKKCLSASRITFFDFISHVITTNLLLSYSKWYIVTNMISHKIFYWIFLNIKIQGGIWVHLANCHLIKWVPIPIQIFF